MTTTDAFMFWTCIAGGLLCLVFMYRNHRVFKIRIAFLHEPQGLERYMRLPAYDQMLYSPRYWLLWTKSQWDKQVEAA